jgi:very-short-patch-repair endonuclease
MVDAARELRAGATRSEELLWEVLRNRRFEGLKFMRQQPIGSYILDFYCASERLAIEVDGSVHDSDEVTSADVYRQDVIDDLEIQVVRIRAELVERDIDAALEVIRRSLRKLQ